MCAENELVIVLRWCPSLEPLAFPHSHRDSNKSTSFLRKHRGCTGYTITNEILIRRIVNILTTIPALIVVISYIAHTTVGFWPCWTCGLYINIPNFLRPLHRYGYGGSGRGSWDREDGFSGRGDILFSSRRHLFFGALLGLCYLPTASLHSSNSQRVQPPSNIFGGIHASGNFYI